VIGTVCYFAGKRTGYDKFGDQGSSQQTVAGVPPSVIGEQGNQQTGGA